MCLIINLSCLHITESDELYITESDELHKTESLYTYMI